MDLLTEFTILCYLLVGNLSTWFGEDNLPKEKWSLIQIIEIYMILATAGFNVIQVLYTGVLSIYNLIQDRKYKVAKIKKSDIEYDQGATPLMKDGKKKVRSKKKVKSRAKNKIKKVL